MNNTPTISQDRKAPRTAPHLLAPAMLIGIFLLTGCSSTGFSFNLAKPEAEPTETYRLKVDALVQDVSNLDHVTDVGYTHNKDNTTIDVQVDKDDYIGLVKTQVRTIVEEKELVVE